MILALLGAGYALVLWAIACRTAARRGIVLGDRPTLAIVASGGLSVAIAAGFAAPIAPALAASTVGAIVCAIVDRRTGLIFDSLTAVMSLVAGVLAVRAGQLGDGLIAAALIGGILLSLYRFTGRRGLGLGDVKLGTALALGYGLQLAVIAIGGAFIIGAAYALVAIGLGRAKRSDALRFGPFIASGAVASIVVNAFGYRW